MNILKRILLFLGLFVVISSAIFIVGAVFAGVIAGRGAADPSMASKIASAAGRSFALRYGELIYGVSLISAAGIAFRWYGAAIATAVCAGIIYLSGGIGSIVPLQSTSQVAAVSTAGGSPSARLAEAVTVKLSYGKVSLPAGTPVEVLGETGDSVQLRLHTGQQITVPKSKVK